jgi:flavin-dependent dehydrogenase
MLCTVVVVAGGGPAGAATALMLARRGVPVVLLERRTDNRHVRIGEILPPHSRTILQALGIWDRFLTANHLSSPGITAVWGSALPHENDFIFSPYGYGWHLDRPDFDTLLVEEAERAGAQVIQGTRLIGCAPEGNQSVLVEARTGAIPVLLRTSFVVDATGRAASVTRGAGGSRQYYDRLVGLVVFFSLPPSAARTSARTLIEAVEDGWWYSAVIPRDHLVVTLITDSDLVQAQGAKAIWDRALQQAPLTCERVIQQGWLEGTLRVTAARTYCTEPVVGVWWAAVGDAATTWDPLSSQGITKALEEGFLLAETIYQHLRGNSSALPAFSDRITENFAAYLHTRAWYYRQEMRWPHAPFWKRRHGPEG